VPRSTVGWASPDGYTSERVRYWRKRLNPFGEPRLRPLRPNVRRLGRQRRRSIVERESTKRVVLEEVDDVGSFASVDPLDRRELEEAVLGPARQQAEKVAHVQPLDLHLLREGNTTKLSAGLKLLDDLEPGLGAFVLLDPHPEDFFAPCTLTPGAR
jgi:hypothetical protein